MVELGLWAQVLVLLMVAGVVLASGQGSLMHPAIWYLGFHLVVFVLRPILVHCFGFTAEWDYMIFHPSDAVFVRTLAVSSVGLVVFVGACLIAGWAEVGFSAREPRALTPVQKRGLLFATLALLPLVALSIYATRKGINRELAGAAYIMTDSTGYLNEAQNVMAPLLCLWLVVTRFHRLNVLPIVLYLGYRSWYGWSRWTILLFAAMVAVTYCWYHRKKWIPLWSILVAVPVFLLFNVLGHNRELLKSYLEGKPVKTYESEPGITTLEQIKLRYDGPDFANFDFLAYLVAVVPERTQDFTYGLQHLQLFTEPIPRILWKRKPVGAPVKTMNPFEWGNFVGLTITLPGDGWMTGGWAGLVLTTGLTGVVLGRCHRRFWLAKDRPIFALFYIAGLAMLPQLYRDGSVVSLMKFLLFTWLPFLPWVGFNWVLGHRRAPEPPVVLAPRGNVVLIQGQGGNGWANWAPRRPSLRR
jgi:hypothetical protein